MFLPDVVDTKVQSLSAEAKNDKLQSRGFSGGGPILGVGLGADGQSQCSRGEECLREHNKEKENKAEKRGDKGERKDDGGGQQGHQEQMRGTNLTNCDKAEETKKVKVRGSLLEDSASSSS